MIFLLELDLEIKLILSGGLLENIRFLHFSNFKILKAVLSLYAGIEDIVYNETLNSPLKRAAYILTIRGKDVEKVDQNDLSMEVLVEQMELRELLGDIPKDDTALQALEDLKNSAHGKIQKKQLKFAKEIESGDLSAAKQTFHELQFLFKLLAEIEESEERLLDY